MKDKRVIFDFGSTYFTVFYDGKVVSRTPCAVIIKRSLQPTVVAFGEEALTHYNDITDDEMFWQPVKKGAVAHLECCAMLVKHCLTEAFGVLARPPICVLVSCGLNVEQRAMIEKVFVGSGYNDVFLMESLLGMASFAEQTGLNAGIIIGGETTEVGIFAGHKLVSGYSLDLGSFSVNEKIKSYVSETHKVILSDAAAEELKKSVASLYPNDFTRQKVTGKDPITGRVKNVTIVAKELYPSVAFVYGRIVKVLEAALSAAPIEILRKIAETGVLIAGSGSRQEGLADYVEKNLLLPAHIAEPADCLPWAGAEKLANDPEFVKNYLRIFDPDKSAFFKQ